MIYDWVVDLKYEYMFKFVIKQAFFVKYVVHMKQFKT